MISEFKKSIDSILHERLSSPFFGSFIISWIIWNWEPIYLSIFISEDKLRVTKLTYIIAYYSDIWHLLWYPLFSTLFFILLAPFLTLGSYWIGLKFTSWKNRIRVTEERNQLLTLEQSIQIREEIQLQTEKFQKLLRDRDNEIESLEKQLAQYAQNIQLELPEAVAQISQRVETVSNEEEFLALASMPNFSSNFKDFAGKVISGYTIRTVPHSDLNLYYSHDLIETRKDGAGKYDLTPKGKLLLKYLNNSIVENQ